ncbi:MAG TPA: GNAT family N-acetyltransferase [Hyphomicrobiaceae bacterium]|nr:GNAT family N-acetyltransferase [Hyphomicrobiaceae bacterium]
MANATIATRGAAPEDAEHLAQFVNAASDGLSYYLWERTAGPGETAWCVGRRRARREEGSFSYRNAVIAEISGSVAGCLIGYPLPDEPQPIDAEMPAMFVPLQELENRACGTWYVNVLATYPAFRRRGVARHLLALAETAAKRAGRRGLSIIVADTNAPARRLYEFYGFRQEADWAMVKEGWQGPGTRWLLLVKPLGG